jgi:hypothetical protein
MQKSAAQASPGDLAGTSLPTGLTVICHIELRSEKAYILVAGSRIPLLRTKSVPRIP